MRSGRLVAAAVLSTLACLRAAPVHAQRGGTTAVQLELSVSPASISFASASPDVSPFVTAAPIVITVRVRGNAGPWSLTVLANGAWLARSTVRVVHTMLLSGWAKMTHLACG